MCQKPLLIEMLCSGNALRTYSFKLLIKYYVRVKQNTGEYQRLFKPNLTQSMLITLLKLNISILKSIPRL